ncbi:MULTISPECIES: 16S rRNA (guanine(966)-N(2))-methyltransferase RsmD [Psychrobacter]|uniref:16S rRNA (guanine(966)-N(2))-methyltransferase RsmD n=1 Tax=Psychrobacter TaxID=497 RepID=UPI00146E55EE|nr:MULTISPECIES: 16S rRNA (guanine(966)-N(2))-methyltransferase RsmD [Psychrobacter]
MKQKKPLRQSVSKTKKSPLKKSAAQTSASKTTLSDVRIIGGALKRRTVSFIDADGLRPTPDRLRETLFNWLMIDIFDARVLDAFAGSGVLGFEALSRGAANCTFIEANLKQSQQLATSAQKLNLNAHQFNIIHGFAETVLNQQNLNAPFDIVFIDPPYALDLWQPVLIALIQNHWIDDHTLIYLEADHDLTPLLSSICQQLNTLVNTENNCLPIAFICQKHAKVGQVYAGLYRLKSA